MNERSFVDLMEIISIQTKALSNNDILLEIYERMHSIGLPFENCIDVKESIIHRNGVFAKTDIEPNMVIGMYPCHGILTDDGLSYCSKKNIDIIKSFDTSGCKISDYKIKIPNTNKYIFGIPHIQADGFIGHLINDSYKHISELKNIDNSNDYGKKMIKYILNSNIYDNCVLVSTPNYVYVKTKKYIHRNEEILASYGFNYWCEELNGQQCNILFVEYYKTLSCNQTQFCKKLYYDYIQHAIPLEPSDNLSKFAPLLSKGNFMKSIQKTTQIIES